MNAENEPNQCASPANGEIETTISKEATAEEASYYRKNDLLMRMYLAGVTVTVVCSFIFNVISVSLKLDDSTMSFLRTHGSGPMTNLIKLQESRAPTLTMFNAGVTGMGAVLSALAGVGLGLGIWVWNLGGIGIWIWNPMVKKKEAWGPLAISAGLSVLMFLLVWIRNRPVALSTPDMEFHVSMTLLGFWLPFAGAIAATFVSAKRILE